MCLEKIRYRRAKIAKEDIPCYKVLRRSYPGFVTPYRSMGIVLGRSYTSELGPILCWRNVLGDYSHIEKGLHAFLSLEQAIYNASNGNELCVVKCVVPKGAKYYIGEFHYRFKQTAIAATEIKYGRKPLKSCV